MTNWTDIYNIYYKSLVKYAYSYLHDQHHAEDIVQEIFLRLLEKNISVNFMQHADKYLKTVVYRQCMTFYRQKAKQQSIDIWCARMRDSVNYTEDEIHFRELTHWYRKAISSLPQKQKEVFELRQIYGFNRAEIASMLNKSTKTVKKQYQLSNQQVRKSLKALRA